MAGRAIDCRKIATYMPETAAQSHGVNAARRFAGLMPRIRQDDAGMQ